MFDLFCFKLMIKTIFNPLSANPTKWLNTLKQFDHFVGLALKGLRLIQYDFLIFSLLMLIRTQSYKETHEIHSFTFSKH